LAVTRVEETVDGITSSNLRAYRKTIRETVGALDEQGREKAAIFLEERIREMEGKLGLEPDYDVKVQADPADPTKVNVTCQVPASWCERGLIDLPDNPTIQMETEVHEKLRKSLVDWTTRGNMRHEDKAEKWPTTEEIEEERAKLRAEAEKRTAEMTPATVEEQVEFVKKAVEMGCSKLIIPFTDDPMGYPPGTGGTPEQVEAARKSILEREDSYILAEMQRITAVQADEDAKIHAALDALAPNERDAAVYHQESLTALIREAVTGKPGYEGRDPTDLVCVHASGDECGCVCHADPPKGIIIHDRHCCNPCFKCGFREVQYP